MNAASEVFTLFAVVLVGYFVTRIGYFDDRTIRGVTQLVVNIALPALTIAKMQRDFSMEILTGFLIVLAASAVLMLLFVAPGAAAFQKTRKPPPGGHDAPADVFQLRFQGVSAARRDQSGLADLRRGLQHFLQHSVLDGSAPRFTAAAKT